ncbi:MAG: sigma-70 family RNA polymerase sigma factor, partial [Planctomycetales bacterium]|nr:sigma-70 family RNA polymerase sigma factor [Planctomycetales bacterium]
RFRDQLQFVEADIYQYIERRLSPRLRRRVDAADVLQETLLIACRAFADFERRRPMPFRTWMLKTAQQQLVQVRRYHLQSQRRSIGREVGDDHSTALLHASLALSASTPSRNLMRAEAQQSVVAALNRLAEIDREILFMREFEKRPYEEIADICEIDAAAARKRFGRALLRLRLELKAAGLLE